MWVRVPHGILSPVARSASRRSYDRATRVVGNAFACLERQVRASEFGDKLLAIGAAASIGRDNHVEHGSRRKEHRLSHTEIDNFVEERLESGTRILLVLLLRRSGKMSTQHLEPSWRREPMDNRHTAQIEELRLHVRLLCADDDASTLVALLPAKVHERLGEQVGRCTSRQIL